MVYVEYFLGALMVGVLTLAATAVMVALFIFVRAMIEEC
jgi:hypothetical protein